MSSVTPPRLFSPVFRRLLVLTVLHFAALATMLLSGRWIRELGGSESVLGWFSASIVPGIVIGALLAGRLASRLAERRLILAGALLIAATSAALAGFDRISLWLAPLRCLQGLGHGIIFTCLVSLAAHTLPDRWKTRGLGYLMLCAQLGNVAGVALAENLLLPLGGFAAVFAGAAGMAGAALLGALNLPDRLSHAGDGPGGAGLTPRTGEIVIAVAFFFILGGSYGTVLQLIPLLVLDLARFTGDAPRATPIMAVIFLTVAASRLFLAHLADGRFRRPVLVGSTLLLVLSTAGWPLAGSSSALLAVAFFFGLGYGLLFPGLNGLVLTRVAGRFRSRASGWIVMAFDGGFFGLLLLLGPIAEMFGYRLMFILLCSLQACGALLFLAMVRHVVRRTAADAYNH